MVWRTGMGIERRVPLLSPVGRHGVGTWDTIRCRERKHETCVVALPEGCSARSGAPPERESSRLSPRPARCIYSDATPAGGAPRRVKRRAACVRRGDTPTRRGLSEARRVESFAVPVSFRGTAGRGKTMYATARSTWLDFSPSKAIIPNVSKS